MSRAVPASVGQPLETQNGQEVSRVRTFSQKGHHRTGPQQEEHGWGSLVSGEEVGPECSEQRADWQSWERLGLVLRAAGGQAAGPQLGPHALGFLGSVPPEEAHTRTPG